MACRRTNAEAEVLLYLRHCPEKDMHRFPGRPTDFTSDSDNDKAVYPVAFRRSRASYTLRSSGGYKIDLFVG